MREFGPISLFFRELWCWVVGHRWARINVMDEGVMKTGRGCRRCGDAVMREFRGRFPLLRVRS